METFSKAHRKNFLCKCQENTTSRAMLPEMACRCHFNVIRDECPEATPPCQGEAPRLLLLRDYVLLPTTRRSHHHSALWERISRRLFAIMPPCMSVRALRPACLAMRDISEEAPLLQVLRHLPIANSLRLIRSHNGYLPSFAQTDNETCRRGSYPRTYIG